jgi:hypothetical protein
LNFLFQQYGIYANVNLLAGGHMMDAWSAWMFIILAFSFDLTGTGMALNICLLLATLIKIAISFWCLAVNSAKEENRHFFKWQCLMTQLVSGIVLCFSAGVIRLTDQGRFYANATQVGAN